ncbi:MAG TPA: carboxypeptidase-like regulatory domain-containing protein, partial [Candidatus Limnocylindrales bacterium]|nr:carboxypeptidase-like regulatory domain-containing protein [Candidatus Limnocylindrales bacterium]
MVLIFAVAAMSSVLFAQGGESGGVAGVVKDPTGAVVSDATVNVFNEQTKELERGTATTAAGLYSVGSLHPGPYRVEITAKGFRKYVARIDVRLNEVERRDVTLEVGSAAETVEVTAASTLVNTEAPTTGQPIDNQTLTTLPLAEPDYLFLLGLSPGTGSEPADVRTSGRALVDYSVNGQRTTNNSVTMEGISINDFNLAHFDYLPIPNPEAIGEFKVATSLYDASLGSKGGGALGLVLQSGTKAFHGEGWFNNRNDDYNANEWFFNHKGVPRGRLLQNVLGGAASGPVPLLKGFWYFNAQMVRGRNGIDPSGSSAAPTVAAFPTNPDGTTSAALLASDPNLGGAITAAQIDPVAVNILNAKGSYYGGTYLIPRPGQPGCGAASGGGAGEPNTFGCQFSLVGKPSDTQYTATYNRPFRHDKDKVSVSAFWDNSTALKPLASAADLAGPINAVVQNRFGTINYVTQISNRQLNEIKFGANRFVFSTTPTALLTLAAVGATRPDQAAFPGLYYLQNGPVSFGIGVNDFRGTASNSYQIGDNWSMVFGKHTLRAGGDMFRYQLNRFNNFGVFGSLGFTPNANSQATTWENFITGTLTSTQSGAGNPERYFRAWAYDMYLQDDYRFSSRLTVNLGLRWEPMQFAHDKYFRNTNYSFPLAEAGQNPFLIPAAMNLGGVRGDPGVSDCTLAHCWSMKNFAPRVGFAYDLSGNGKTVVRGGFGLYYQQISNQAELQGSLGAPFFLSQITTIGKPAPLQLANPLPNQVSGGGKILPQYVPQKSIFTGMAPGTGCTGLVGQALLNCEVNDPTATAIWTDPAGTVCGVSGGPALDCGIDLDSFTSADPNLHAPYTEQWNLTVQRDLGHNWALEVGYVGSHNVGGIAIWVPTQALLASPTNTITVQDSSANSYAMTATTFANETLREQALGLSFLTGSSYTSNIGNQIYHSFQTTLSHRFQHGLFFQTGYTWAKNIDNVSGSVKTDELNGTTSSSQGGASIYNDKENISGNRALSDLDRRHRLTMSYGYEFPIPKSGIFGTQVFQGWGVSGLTTFQSGQVFSVSDSFGGGAYGFGLSTPTAICGNLVPTLPTCTLGAATDPRQAVTQGSTESRLNNWVNPNFFSNPGP